MYRDYIAVPISYIVRRNTRAIVVDVLWALAGPNAATLGGRLVSLPFKSSFHASQFSSLFPRRIYITALECAAYPARIRAARLPDFNLEFSAAIATTQLSRGAAGSAPRDRYARRGKARIRRRDCPPPLVNMSFFPFSPPAAFSFAPRSVLSARALALGEMYF